MFPLEASAITQSTPSNLEVLSVSASSAYADYVNPEWVRLLDRLGMNVRYRSCSGSELHAEDGRVFLDFLSGYCVHNTGHNHPYIVQELCRELQSSGPAMLQNHVADIAGELGRELCHRAGGQIKKTLFCSSGSEGVEAVIKFARAQTRKSGIVYAHGAFHGLTCGALSLMGGEFWREGFGPMLSETFEVPFNDLEAIERVLSKEKIGAVILEPVQGEAGIVLPEPGYLTGVEALCRRYDALFVLDEVQTGVGRTGRFLAGQHYGVSPDMIVMAKALSGGLVPCGAVLMTDEVYRAVYSSLRRANIHTSTFSENSLAMRAGLATLTVLDQERLTERAQTIGTKLRMGLSAALRPYEMVREVRGLGLMNGVVLESPRQLRLHHSFRTLRAIHPGVFGQVLVRRLYHEHQILSQICANNFMVLKVAPPLVVTDAQIDYYIEAVTSVVEMLHSSPCQYLAC